MFRLSNMAILAIHVSFQGCKHAYSLLTLAQVKICPEMSEPCWKVKNSFRHLLKQEEVVPDEARFFCDWQFLPSKPLPCPYTLQFTA